MIVERIGNGRVLGSSIMGLAIALSSSIVLAAQQQPGQPQPQQQQQQPQPQQQRAQPQPQQQAAQPQQQAAQSQQQQPVQSQQQQAAQPQQQQPAQSARQQPEQGAERQEDVQVAAAAPRAQPAQTMWNGVRIVQVKHDRVADFEALIKELRTAIQASGQPGFSVWSTELGDMNTYHITMQFDSFASFGSMENPPMEPMDWASWMSRIGSTIDSHTVSVARIRPELSIIPDEQQAQEPELLMLITDTVMPGKSFEYEAFIRDEILPALRETDVSAAIANEVIFGTEGRTWVFAVPMQGWQELDRPSPLIEAIGQEAAQQLMQRGDALVDSTKTEIMRYRADLSSQPPG